MDLAANTNYLQQQTDREPAPEQHKPRQRRLFLEDDSEGESDSVQAAATGKHDSANRQKSRKQQQAEKAVQGRALEMQAQQPGRGRHRHFEEALEDSNAVPSTYNNMPLRQKQHPMHDGYANQNFVPEDEEASLVAAEQEKAKSRKQVQQKKNAAQVTGAELEFDASDTESDDYEPTQVKTAAKATARRAAQKPGQAKGPQGKPQRPHQDKQQGSARQACKAARNAADEGHVKRPRGRPRKALPEQEQQPRQGGKRKAAAALDEEEEPTDQKHSKATVKAKAGKGDRLKKIALLPAPTEAEDQGAEVRCQLSNHVHFQSQSSQGCAQRKSQTVPQHFDD